jgi:hypothetical protein
VTSCETVETLSLAAFRCSGERRVSIECVGEALAQFVGFEEILAQGSEPVLIAAEAFGDAECFEAFGKRI